jgi:TldD protein
MKKYTSIICLLGLVSPVFAQTMCQVQQQRPLQLLSKEIKRSMKIFKKQNPPIYYIAYNYSDVDIYDVKVEEKGITNRSEYRWRELQVQARAGTPQMDNTRTLKTGKTDRNLLTMDLPDIGGDGKAFSTVVWRLTEQIAEEAQQDFNRVHADAQTAAKRLDNSPDFVFPPKETFCQEYPALTFDTQQIEALLVKVSDLTQGKPFVLNSSFSFEVKTGSRYFVDSVGTQLKTPVRLARLMYTLEGKTADGSRVSRSEFYDVLDEKELPSEEKLTADIKKSLQELQDLLNAPEAEPITAPTLLKNRAMAVFVHEVLGHRMEGHRQKEDDFGRTFTDKIGQEVVSPLLTIVDDATLSHYNNIPLRGFYQYDEEGVKARPVILVKEGVLKEFLMSSSPIKGFPTSNGHGRGEMGKRPVARMGNTRVIASQTVPYEELEQQLLEEIKRQRKPYGFIIEDLSGGFTMTQTNYPQTFKLTPTLVYRVYADGRKEMVRGADIVGTPLAAFHEVMAAADDYDVFNGSCGAESGWVPVSGIAPSVLLRKLEIEKTGKSAIKPPLLPPPFGEGK